jgi:cytosine/adenosine deaminase-related metal-dependent hydrolase
LARLLLEPDYVLLGTGVPRLVPGLAVQVDGDRIAAVGAPKQLAAAGGERLRLAGQVLMPGLVNAHQHGRGVTALQLGFEDDYLEPWMAFKRRRLQLDPYLQTLYASLAMLANGVTGAIHANSVGGGAGYPAEVEAQLRAYADSGLRVMFGVGAMDRAELAYPPAAQAGILAGLPEALRARLGDVARPAYCAGIEASLAFMDALRSRFAGHARIGFAWSPAGPHWVSDELLGALARDAAAHGTPIHMHALESAAQADTANAMWPEGLLRHLEGLGVLGPLTSFAHAVWLTADDAALGARHGVTLVRNPASNLRLHAGIAPLAHYVAAGLRVALGSDNTTLNDDEDLFTEARLARALTRSPAWDAPPALDVPTLWAMMSANGAHAMGRGAQTGEIAPGRLADLVALDLARVRTPYLDPDLDLLAALLGRARGADVRLTMVGGDILFRDGRFPRHDLAALEERCRVDGVRSKALPAMLTRAEADTLNDHLRAHYARLRVEQRQPRRPPLAARSGWTEP